MSSENNSAASATEKVTLRGIQSVAGSQMVVNISPGAARWPIVLGNPPRVANDYRERTPDLAPAGQDASGAGRPVVVTGLGGVGKTQAAAALVARLLASDDLDLTLWISASSRQAILLMYRHAAREVLDLDPASELPEDWLSRLFEWFATTQRRWLIVFDDLQQDEDLTNLIPSGPQGRVVATTRSADLARFDSSWRRVRIGVYDSAESTAYLNARLASDPQLMVGAKQLAEELGHLPLALSQAASYISHYRITCSAYLKQLRMQYGRQKGVPLANADIAGGSDLLYATTRLALEAVGREADGGASLALAGLAALLDPNGMPYPIFTTLAVRSYIARRSSRSLQEGVIADALNVLSDVGLTSKETFRDLALLRMPASVRPLVVNEAGDLRRAASAAADGLLEAWPNDDYSQANTGLTHAMFACLETLRSTMPDPLWQHDELHPVLLQAGQSRLSLGLLDEAVTYWRQLVSEAERRLGATNVGTVRATANLGAAYQEAGRVAEALPLMVEAVENSRRLLGEAHPETLTAYNNLATCYQRVGRLADAIGIFERTLRLRQQDLGPDDPATLASLNNLAAAYQESGRYSEATALLAAASQGRERVLGASDPDTLLAKHNLALLYIEQGDVDRGLELLERVNAEAHRVLGAAHPRTLATRGAMGAAYLAAGRVQEAVSMLESTLPECEATLGPRHPDTLAIRNNLARGYQAVGRVSDAVYLLEANTAACVETLGSNHPDTLASQNSLAVAYRAVGRGEEALELLRSVLDKRVEVLGDNHPDTIDSRGRLAAALFEAGHMQESIALQESVLEQQIRTVGPQHPATLNTRNSLALAYQRLGKMDVARELFERNLADRREVLGPLHPATLAAQNNLAIAYWDAGRVSDAATLLNETLEGYESVLGPAHPSAIAARANLALAVMELGDTSRAIDLLETNMRYSHELYGPADSTTLSMASNLANAYKAAGRVDDALRLLENSHVIAVESLGPSDGTTRALQTNLELVRQLHPKAN
jgi:tetratricopeptide (TPR) repeat protein